MGCGGLNWSDLAQNRDRWHALINAVIKLGVPQIRVVSRLAEDKLASLKRFCSMELVSKLVSWMFGWLVSQSVTSLWLFM